MMRYFTLLLSALLLTSCTRVNVFPRGESDPSAASTPSPSSTEGDDKGPFKPWNEVLKDTRSVDGLIKMHVKRDQTLFLELSQDQLGKDYGMALQFSRGIGDYFAYDGLLLSETRLVRFERIGDQINLVHRNPRFTADAGSAMETSLADNVGHSIIHVAKIESQHEDSKNVLINVTDFFASDYPDLADVFKANYGNKPVSFDKASSFVEKVLGFPKNLEIDAALSYKASGSPPGGSAAVSDYRSLPVAVRYSIFALPDDPMKPRLADDRVGHFLTARKDFSRDDEADPYIRYVNRWRLEKKDPDAARSEPVEPIVFYIDSSVPEPYRKYVREGIEGWNKAFGKAGFKDAVVARDAPVGDTTWSAEDIRHSTVRWSAAHNMGFAIGPSQVDPRTGEILNADILISSIFVRSWLNDYQQMGPEALRTQYEQMTSRLAPSHRAGELSSRLSDRYCVAAAGKAHQVRLQHVMMSAMGLISPGAPMPERFLGDAVRDLVMHEVGHTLGLRHNFRASTGIDYARLQDTTYTSEHGLSLSVMDYAPVNITANRSEQGHYWNKVVGTYDEWAIKYAYMPVGAGTSASGTNGASGTFSPEAERPVLEDIAEQASRPLHTYGTDEDAHLGPWAVDPYTNTWELGSDPLTFARDRADLVNDVLPELERRLISEGDRYYQLRSGTVSMLYERLVTTLPVTKMIGGSFVARDHKGDPEARPPFTPLPAERQREALQFIVDEVFAPDAFSIDREVLNRLAPNRFSHWGASTAAPIDFPVLDYVEMVHAVVIDELMHPARFQRMLNAELRTEPGDVYRVSEMLAALTGGVWSELQSNAAPNAFRRNLQRLYTDQLIRLMLGTPPWRVGPSSEYPVPEHVRSVSRLELTELGRDIGAALSSVELDRDTRAHLLETQARIVRALEASVTTDAE